MFRFMRHAIELWTKISFYAVFHFIDFGATQKWWGVGGEGWEGGSVTRQSTHISLGNLLSFAGVCQGAHTQVRDGDSRAGSKCDQHQENP